jgi:hypothetical protein
MSAQPNVDAGEIRHNRMKLAMAVGDSRHYVIDSIVPRHFLQTAASSGVPASLVQGILDEIENDTDRAIDGERSAARISGTDRFIGHRRRAPAAAFVYPCDGMSGKSAELADLVVLN